MTKTEIQRLVADEYAWGREHGMYMTHVEICGTVARRNRLSLDYVMENAPKQMFENE